ncbi:hypothetical protein K488DRAFT_43021, partial [Vararia minispora EC-137]
VYERALELVDESTRLRCRRFYHRADAYRCLIGRLLPRVLLARDGVPPASITFSETPARKPFFATPDLVPPIAYNISHDNEGVAMAFVRGARDGVGVDIMRLSAPRRGSFASFVDSVGDTLTPRETATLLAPSLPGPAALRTFYRIWTTKEAYAKSIGLGLGFDFARIECAFGAGDTMEVRVDGRVPRGWTFRTYRYDVGAEPYEVVAARFEEGSAAPCVVQRMDEARVRTVEARVFVEEAIRLLG